MLPHKKMRAIKNHWYLKKVYSVDLNYKSEGIQCIVLSISWF